MLVKLLSEFSKAPIRKTDGAAGYDLSSIEDVDIPANSRKLVDIGLSFTVPENTYGQIAPRSGLAVKGIDIGAGVIDHDYTGPVKVLMINTSDTVFTVEKGSRIAQLIIKKIETPEINIVDDLSVTDRGNGGFGSTGV